MLCFFIIPLLVLVILRVVLHLSVFPGSFCCVRIPVENTVSGQVAQVYSRRMFAYAQIIEALEKDNVLNLVDQRILQEQTDEIKRMLEFLLCDTKMLKRKSMRKLSSIYGNLLLLSSYIKEFEVSNEKDQSFKLIDLDTYIEKLNIGLVKDNVRIYFKDESEKKKLVELTYKVSKMLSSYIKTPKCCGILCTKTKFATPFQMRWSLKNKFHARHFRLQASQKRRCLNLRDPVTLDLYLLPCLYSNDSKREDDAIKESPTIIICFPNGGFVEYFYFQCEWVNFYLEMGINVLLWNYRGYYRSTGSPTAYNILRDSQQICKFLRNKLEVHGLIGAHGESLGGYVASHLAKTRQLDFLFVDRSFCCLDKLIQAKYGKCMMKCFKCISGFNVHSDANYLDTKCFKIIAQDSCDEVINPLGGLKNGITSRLITNRPNPPNFSISDINHFIDTYKDLCHQRDEITTLFRINGLTLEKDNRISEPNCPKKFIKKVNPGAHNFNPLNSLMKSDSNITKSTSSNGYRFKSFNSSGGLNGFKNKLREEEKVVGTNKDDEHLPAYDHDINVESIPNNLVLPEPIRETDENKIEISVSEASISGGIGQMKIPEDHKLSKSLIKDLFILLYKTFKLLNLVDSAGDKIDDIMLIKNLKSQRENMEFYFLNFEIWGSYENNEKEDLLARRESALQILNRLTTMSVNHIEEFQLSNTNNSVYTINIVLNIIKILLYFEVIRNSLLKKKADSTILENDDSHCNNNSIKNINRKNAVFSANPYRAMPKSHLEKEFEEDKDMSNNFSSNKNIKYNQRCNSSRSKKLSDVENQLHNDRNSGSVFSKMTNADSNNQTTQSLINLYKQWKGFKNRPHRIKNEPCHPKSMAYSDIKCSFCKDTNYFENKLKTAKPFFNSWTEPTQHNLGAFINIKCGHRGNYSDQERDILKYWMKQAKFYNFSHDFESKDSLEHDLHSSDEEQKSQISRKSKIDEFKDYPRRGSSRGHNLSLDLSSPARRKDHDDF